MTSLPARTLAPLVALTCSLVLAGATPALAKGDDDVRRSGSCSGSATWKVEAGEEDGRVEVEGEIDSNRAGQTWRWSLAHNGSRSASGKRTTAGRSGSFEVRRELVDLRGTDTFVLTARRPATGETCRGTVRF